MAYFKKVIAWSTSQMIRLRYYSNFMDAGQNICRIDLPTTQSAKFPDYVYNPSTMVKPSIIFQKSRQNIHDPHPNNITLITSWYNMIKVTELIYDPSKDKFFASAQAKKSVNRQDIFIGASSFFEVDGLTSKYITV